MRECLWPRPSRKVDERSQQVNYSVPKLFHRLSILLFALLAAIAQPAFAGPPYETDDPDPTAYRNYEIYFFTEYHRVGPNIDVGSIGTLEANYGLLPNTQFSVTIPGAFAPQAAGTRYGLGDIEIALKYRFVPEDAGRPQISFYPAVTLATGDPATGLGEGRGTLFLPLWAQKSYGSWTIFGGCGLQLDREDGHFASWREGLAVTRDLSDATNVGVEVYRSTQNAMAPQGYTDLGVGIIQGIGKYHAIVASFGRSLAPSSFHGYAAYEWRLGPQGKDK